METTLSLRDYTVASIAIDPTQVTGEGGPRCPRLVLPLRIRSQSSPPWAIDRKIATLIALDYALRSADQRGRMFAQGWTFPAQDLGLGGDLQLRLALSLDPYRLKEIEGYRASGNLVLRLDSRLIVALPEDTSRHPPQAEGVPRFPVAEIRSVDVQLTFEIPRSVWVERILPQLKDPSLELVEVPLGGGRLKDAAAYLEAAEAAFHGWDTKSVYANCREMATALDRTIRQRLQSDTFATEERWGRAYKRLGDLASLDLHLEDIKKREGVDAQQVRIDRRDAECVLFSAKILLKYANELLPEE